MRTRLATICLVASTFVLSPVVAYAQPKKPAAAKKDAAKKDDKKAAADDKKTRNIDLDADVKEGPVTAGQMTEDAAQAQAPLRRARSGATPRRRSTASSTARPATTRATSRSRSITSRSRSTASSSTRRAYAIFSEIADKPNHLKFNETLLWLAKLATDLPEPADIVERVGKYNDEQIAKFNNPKQQRSLLAAQLPARPLQVPQRPVPGGARALREGRPQEQVLRPGAVLQRHLERAAPQEHAGGRRRSSASSARSTRASRASRTRRACATSRSSRWRARTTRRRVRLDEQQRADDRRGRSSRRRSSTGTRSTSRSEYWLDALFEESWAYFMAGDYSHALGNIHTIEAPYFPNSYYPEADVLKAVIYFANCQYDDATTIVAQFQRKYQPIRDELNKDARQVQGRRTRRSVLQVPEGRARRARRTSTAEVEPIVETRSRDRQLLRNLEYVRLLDEEETRFKKAPASFQELAGRQRRQGRAPRSRASSPSATPGSSRASATSATSTSSTSTSATGRRSSSTSPPRKRNQLDQAIAGQPGHRRRSRRRTS